MDTYNIIPRPKKLEFTEEASFSINLNTRILVDISKLPFDRYIVNKACDILKKTISSLLLFEPQIVYSAGNDIYLPKHQNQIKLTINQSLAEKINEYEGNELYRINILRDSICLEGMNEQSLIFAVQTLCRLIEQNSLDLRCLEIVDYPSFPRRGFYHDVTRGRIPKLSFLKFLADTMSKYKMNELQLYIEHSYLFVEESEVWRDDTVLSADEIVELDDYCYSLGIELVPSISSFGHLEKLLQTRSFHKHCELEVDVNRPFSYMGRMRHHTVDVNDEVIFDYICRRIDEFSALCRSRRFNICGDETFDLCNGKNKDLAEKVGKTRVYIDFIKKLEKHLSKRGLTMQFWGDVIAAKPELAAELSQDTVCLVWDYAYEPKAIGTDVLHNIGVKQYLCPGTCGWNCKLHYNEGAYHNNLGMAKFAHNNQAIGILNTNWGDFGHLNDPFLSIPGLIYGALFSWSSPSISGELDYDQLNKEIANYYYKDQSGNLLKLSDEISYFDIFNWYNLVKFHDLQYDLDSEELKTERLNLLKTLYEKIKDSEEAELLKNLDEKIAKLYEVISKSSDKYPESRREKIAYIIGAENVKICLKLFFRLLEIYKIKGDIEKTKLSEVAEEIEYFVKKYEDFWRLDNKESELPRLMKVYFYFCDILRDAL